MKLESKYIKNGFKRHKQKLKLYHLTILPFILLIISISFSDFLITLPLPENKDTFNILTHLYAMKMRIVHFLIIGYFISGLIYLNYKRISQKKPIIVSIEFKDNEKLLILKTRMLFKSRLKETIIPYQHIRLEKIKRLYDPISNAYYTGFYICNMKEQLGIILDNHFTWHHIWYQKINNKLKTIRPTKINFN